MTLKKNALTTALLLSMAGCGGGSGDDNPTNPTPQSATITVLDGYLYNADVFTGADCTTALGKTNKQGQLTVNEDQIIDKLCAFATAGVTVDMTRGVVPKSFDLTAINNEVVTPFTDYIAKKVASGSTEAGAINELIDDLSTLNTSKELLLGDYLSDNSSQAKALLVIGEALIDHDDKSLSTKSAIITAISSDIADAVNNGNFNPKDRPSITVDDQGGVEIEADDGNQAPSIIGSINDIDAQTDTALQNVDLSTVFKDDVDGALDLLYSLNVVGQNDTIGLTVSGGILSGTPTMSGTFLVEIKATDLNGASSDAVLFTLNVNSPAVNNAPVVNQNFASTIQSALGGQGFYVGEPIDTQFELNGLFSDADNDELTYSVSADALSSGLNVSLNSSTLAITGTATETGSQQFSVTANDGKVDSTPEHFTFMTTEKPVNPPPTLDTSKSQRVVDWFNGLNLQVGVAVSDDVDINALFIDDDLKDITLTGSFASFGYDVTITNDRLSITGTGTKDGAISAILNATDADGGKTSLTLSSDVKPKENLKPTINASAVASIQAIADSWVVEIGSPVNYSVNISGLFSDPENDILTFTANTNIIGLTANVDSSLELTITGTPSNTNQNGAKTLSITSNDSANGTDVSRNVPSYFGLTLSDSPTPTASLSDIEDIDATPITDGRMMYSIAHYTEYDDGQTYYPPSYQCLGLRFENGYYGFYMSSMGKTCEDNLTASDFTKVKEYANINNYVYAYPLNQSVATADEIFSIKLIDDMTGEIVLTQKFPNMTPVVIDTGVMYDTAAEANAKITRAQKVSYKSYFPDPDNQRYVSSQVTAEKTGFGQAEFTIQASSSLLTCDVLNSYDGFQIVIGDTVQDPATSNCQASNNEIKVTLTYTELNGFNEAYFYNYPTVDTSAGNENPALYFETLGAVLPNQNM